jgi:hypothetical protein
MDDRELARQQPKDIDEALDRMRATLEVFHRNGDKRAIFLRLYYIMTLEVHAAVNGLGAYRGKTVFLDPGWIRTLSGRFATLYFHSLDTAEREPDPSVERAWKAAHGAAASARSTVVQNALLGINAHINYDLPRAIAANLDPGDLKDYPRLQLRKFDHDQVNNLLLRTLEPIQEVLARDYEPGIRVADWLLGRFDEQLSKIGLTHYRERVWWDALACAAAMQDDDKDEDVVREKLNWESYKIALVVDDEKLLWEAERLVDLPWAWRPQRWDEIELEHEGGIDVPHGRPLRLFR